MTQPGIWLAILTAAAVSLAVRALPLTLIRRQIKNRFIRSFLFYVPYVTLAVITFPDILRTTDSVWSGLLALLAGIALAWSGQSLFVVAVASCLTVFISEFFL